MIRLLRLSGRLTAGGGRESVIRLVLTGLGLAVAVTLLLSAAVLLPALHAHDVARAWTETGPEPRQPAQDPATTDPLVWQLTTDRFDGRDLIRVDLHATGPDAPAPPGLDALPGPGEVAVSPALRALMAETEPALLADRFPGEVTATVGREALASPDDLVAFVGHGPGELVDREGFADGIVTVRAIEAAPVTRGVSEAMRIVLVVGALGLLVPVVSFVGTATRLAAARREQRLAALRLAGATTGQVGWVAAVEAGLAAVGGVALGFAAFFALRPRLAEIPFDGYASFPSDLRLSVRAALAVGLGVPVLSVAAALVSLGRIRISPLGAARRTAPRRARAWPLLVMAVGIVALGGASLWASRSTAETAETWVVAGAFLVLFLGMVLSGPWLTAAVARGVGRFARRAPALLAARRLEDNPAAGFRAISSIVLAVFVGSMFSGIATSILAGEGGARAELQPDVVVTSTPTDDGVVVTGADGNADDADDAGDPDVRPGRAALPVRDGLDAAATGRLVDRLQAVDGVTGVVVGHAFPDDPSLVDALVRAGGELTAPVLVPCADAAVLGAEPCEGATAVTMWDTVVDPTGFVAPLSAGELADLPVVAVGAVTDGSTAAIEEARTVLQSGMPRAPVVTRADIDAEHQRVLRTVQRVSNLGLAVVLVVAGCSLAVAVAGSIVERKQPLALLRLSGVRLADLRRMVLAEAAAPLVVVAAASVVMGLGVAALVLASGNDDRPFVLPGLGYWLAVVGGVALALGVVMATLPILSRLTALDTARFE
ncbi:MAG TPA: FtsX-like permease family protein [Acidimicrobiales bacterium]